MLGLPPESRELLKDDAIFYSPSSRLSGMSRKAVELVMAIEQYAALHDHPESWTPSIPPTLPRRWYQ